MLPYRTRGTAILKFAQEIPVYPNMLGDVSDDIDTSHHFYCDAISNGRSRIEANGNRVLELKFWSSRDIEQPLMLISIKMPEWWTPQMYLAAVCSSLQKEKIIVLYQVNSSWGGVANFCTVNEVHWLYNSNKQTLISHLIAKGNMSIM